MSITLEQKNEFYKLITTDNIDNDSTNLCKICDTELEDNFIELSCGHKFNYMPYIMK